MLFFIDTSPKKLWTQEDRLITYRAWVSPIDLLHINDNLSYKELMKKMENHKMDPNRSICTNIEDINEVFSWIKSMEKQTLST